MLIQTKLDGIQRIRFVTGAQKTERCHVGAAFDICIEAAKIAIREFMGSKVH